MSTDPPPGEPIGPPTGRAPPGVPPGEPVGPPTGVPPPAGAEVTLSKGSSRVRFPGGGVGAAVATVGAAIGVGAVIASSGGGDEKDPTRSSPSPASEASTQDAEPRLPSYANLDFAASSKGGAPAGYVKVAIGAKVHLIARANLNLRKNGFVIRIRDLTSSRVLKECDEEPCVAVVRSERPAEKKYSARFELRGSSGGAVGPRPIRPVVVWEAQAPSVEGIWELTSTGRDGRYCNLTPISKTMIVRTTGDGGIVFSMKFEPLPAASFPGYTFPLSGSLKEDGYVSVERTNPDTSDGNFSGNFSSGAEPTLRGHLQTRVYEEDSSLPGGGRVVHGCSDAYTAVRIKASGGE